MATKVSSDGLISNAVINNSVNYVHPMYRYVRVYPTQQSAIILTDASPLETVLTLPNDVGNFYHSYFTFTYNLAANGGAYIYNQLYSYFNAWFQSIRLTSNNSPEFLNIPQLSYYLNLITPVEHKYCELPTRDYDNGFTYMSCAQLANNRYISCDGAAGVPTTNQLIAIDASRPLNEVSYMNYLPVAPLANTAITGTYRFNLRDIKNSIFSLDKDIYWSDTLQMHVMWNPLNKIGFASGGTAASNPGALGGNQAAAAGAAAAGGAPTGQRPLVSGAVTITNFALWIALENNENLRQSVKASFSKAGGEEILVPVINQASVLNAAMTQQTYNVTISGVLGSYLQKVIYAPYNGSFPYYNGAYEHSNLFGSRIQTYNTFINSKKLQENAIDCTSTVGTLADDFNANRDSLKGSLITNYTQYQMLWHHIDKFDGHPGPEDKQLPYDNSEIISGWPLNEPLVWTMQATTANVAITHMVFAVTLRKLSVKPGRIELR